MVLQYEAKLANATSDAEQKITELQATNKAMAAQVEKLTREKLERSSGAAESVSVIARDLLRVICCGGV